MRHGLGSPAGRRASNRRGQSLVEFALIFPILLVVLAGILDFGFLLYSRMTVISAAREGARWAVYQSNVTAIPGDLNSQTGAIGANLTGLTWSDLSSTIACIPNLANHNACDFAAGGVEDAEAGDSIRVAVTYTYRSFFSQLFGSTVPLGTQVQMVLEVPQ
ncbi:MAG TPA: TadE/TadG family type IV pilus assembly protein [Candidatus Limnocylindrales bacterium]|jgi:Flp pilus assembly protein TadG